MHLVQDSLQIQIKAVATFLIILREYMNFLLFFVIKVIICVFIDCSYKSRSILLTIKPIIIIIF